MSHVFALPKITIAFNGVPLPSEETRFLVEVRVQQKLSLPSQCELRFAGLQAPIASLEPIPAGAECRVTVSGHQVPLFIGEITVVEYNYSISNDLEIYLRAYDRLHRLRKNQPVRAFVQVTALDLAKEMVAPLGLNVKATEPGPLQHQLIQYHQSDFDILSEITESCGLYFTLGEDTLHLLTLVGLGEPMPLVRGDNLFAVKVEVNGEATCRKVSTSGWNLSQLEVHEGYANAAQIGRRTRAEISPAKLGSSGEWVQVDEAIQNEQQAQAAAQAELNVQVAREVTLSGTAEGDPRLRPGTPILLENVVAAVAGQHVLTAVTHTINTQQGFISQISTMPPPPRARQWGSMITLAIVSRVDDPEKRGRVRVSLPVYNQIETDWLNVVMPAAGTNKGLIALPDVGDSVLLLFSHNKPERGVVLGGLSGVKRGHDSGIEGGAAEQCYSFVTPKGQRIQLDDSRNCVRIENQQGSYVELSNKKVRIHSEADLQIEAPGQKVVIRGKAIDFESA